MKNNNEIKVIKRPSFSDTLQRINVGFIVRVPYENVEPIRDGIEAIIKRYDAFFIYSKVSQAKLLIVEKAQEEI